MRIGHLVVKQKIMGRCYGQLVLHSQEAPLLRCKHRFSGGSEVRSAKKQWGLFTAIAVAAEFMSSLWQWGRASTDTIRTNYSSFWVYASEHWLPWGVFFLLFSAGDIS